MIESIMQGFGLVMSLQVFVAMAAGVAIGIIFGSIPGLTFSMGIILVLPITFGLEVMPAITILLGVYIGGMTGGSVSAILLGIPGTPSAAATCIDGYPLAKQGEAGKALGTALIASVISGLISIAILIIIAPQIARFALRFGPPEIFALVLFGFSTICGVSLGNVVKGLISGFIGLLIMTIGIDPVMGMQRYTFGNYRLLAGVNLLVFMIGMFAIPQIIRAISGELKEDDSAKHMNQKVQTAFPSFKELRGMIGLIIRCSLLGIGIGSIPGAGGPVAAFLGYDQAQRSKKSDEPSLKGVAGPEAANNGVTGGALIPMLTLGIPGDPSTAILLGALLIHGLRPGPLLFSQHGDFIYGIFIALMIIYGFTFLFQGFGIRLFVKVLGIKQTYLHVTILLLCVIGSYAINNNFFDVYVMFFAGVLGYFMLKYGFPVTPAVLALVLGPTMEEMFRRALILSRGDLMIFVKSPIALFFYALTVLVIVNQIRQGIKTARKKYA